MAEHCMVIAGEWESSPENHWDFSIDKKYMTKIVPFRNDITLTELLSNVFKDFFDKPDIIQTDVLSYWPPKRIQNKSLKSTNASKIVIMYMWIRDSVIPPNSLMSIYFHDSLIDSFKNHESSHETIK
ncbi:hypothetical protein Rs2_50094 [Raphanus sativus]|nr:hypothetical protein Rs2_50266 [Raphanus sativus]KAJ4868353.1 hypothetical protein Rs2_50094 [Raphanus sativus]